MSARSRVLIAVALVLAIGGGALLFLMQRGAAPAGSLEPTGGASAAPAVVAAGSDPAHAPVVTAPRAPATSAPPPPPAPPTSAVTSGGEAKASARQAELLATIRRARGEESPPPAAARDGGAALGAEEIRGAIRALTPKLHECYASRLKEQEGLGGVVVAKFTIVAKDGKGTIDEGEIKKSTLGDLRLETCMLHALTTARFPVPRGEGRVTVNYPFRFSPKK